MSNLASKKVVFRGALKSVKEPLAVLSTTGNQMMCFGGHCLSVRQIHCLPCESLLISIIAEVSGNVPLVLMATWANTPIPEIRNRKNKIKRFLMIWLAIVNNLYLISTINVLMHYLFFFEILLIKQV